MSAVPATMAASDGYRRRWWIVILLALACVIAYVDRVNLSFAARTMEPSDITFRCAFAKPVTHKEYERRFKFQEIVA